MVVDPKRHSSQALFARGLRAGQMEPRGLERRRRTVVADPKRQTTPPKLFSRASQMEPRGLEQRTHGGRKPQTKLLPSRPSWSVATPWIRSTWHTADAAGLATAAT